MVSWFRTIGSRFSGTAVSPYKNIQLAELRPEVATQIIKQYPAFVKMICSLMNEYKGIIESVITSDDQSINNYYSILDSELKMDSESSNQFFELINRVYSDLSKCLDNNELTDDQRNKIIEREFEIVRIAKEKDTEIRNHRKEIAANADKKDSEKRKFNWELIQTASYLTIFGVGIGVAALSGKIDFKFPKAI